MGFYRRFKLRKGERHPALRPRRRWLRILAVVGIVLATAVVMMYLWRVPVRDDLMKRLLTFAADQGFAVEYEQVWGDLFGRIHFTDVSVFQDTDHLVEVEKLELSYKLLPLILEQRFEIARIDIYRPFVRWLLPAEFPEKLEPFDPEFSLDLYRLSIYSGRVELADTLAVNDLDVNLKLKIRQHKFEGVLRNASLMVEINNEERLNLEKFHLEFSYTAPDIIHVRDMIVETPYSSLEGELHLVEGSWGINLNRADIDLSELAPENFEGRATASGRVSEDSTGYGGDFSLNLTGFQTGGVRIADLSLSGQGGSNVFDLAINAYDKLGKINGWGSIELGEDTVKSVLHVDEMKLFRESGLPLVFAGEVAVDAVLAERVSAVLEIQKLVLTDESGFPADVQASARADYLFADKLVRFNIDARQVSFLPVPQCPIRFSGEIEGSYQFSTQAADAKGKITDIRIQNSTWNMCSFDAGYSRDRLNLRRFLIKDGLSQIAASGVWSRDTVEGSLDIHNFPLATLGNLNPLGCPADVDAKITLSGNDRDPEVSGILLLRGPQNVFNTASLELIAFKPFAFSGQANVDLTDVYLSEDQNCDVSLSLNNGYLLAHAQGSKSLSLWTQGPVEIDWEENVYEYDCHQLKLIVNKDTILNRNPFALGYAGDSAYVNQLFLLVGDGVIAANGSWHPGNLPDFSLAIYDLDLSTLGQMAGLPETTRGTVWGQVASRNRNGELTLLYQLGARDVYVDGVEFDSVSLVGEVDRNTLTLDLSTVRGMFLSTASGYVNYDLADTSVIEYYNIDVTLHDVGVWPFDFLAKLGIIEVKDGVVNGEANLSGTIERPSINGWGRVTDATIYVPVANMTADRSYVKLLFSDDKVVFDTIMGYVSSGERGQEGIIRGRGDYNLFTAPNRFFFGFNMDNVLYSPERRIHAIGSGNLYLEGTTTDPLVISGNLRIEEGVIGYELWDEIKVTAPVLAELPEDAPPPQPTYIDLYVSGDRNIWIRNNWMDVEVAADLHIMQQDELYPRIEGVLEAKRGNVYYLDHTLRVEEGKVVFPPTAVLDPELDIWARKKTNQLHPPGSENAQPIEVVLHMGGTLSQPLPELFSDPPVWSETEVIQYLNLHLAPVSAEQTDYTTQLSGALAALASQFGSKWVRDIIGVDVLNVETLGEGSKITVGKYIGDRWFASYTLNLQGEQDNYYQFVVEYQVGENQDIVLERNEEGEHSLRYQIKIRY